MKKTPQRGAALIPALLVVALCAGFAAALAGRLDSNLQWAIYRRDEIAASELARAAIDFGCSVLWDDARINGQVDSLDEIWAANIGTMPVEGGTVSGAISDAQSLFNVNNLLQADGTPSQSDIDALNRLARQAGVNSDVGTALAALMQQTDTREARLIAHVDELADLPAMHAPQLAALRPYLVALPERRRLNVNTAQPEVLAAYVPGNGAATLLDVVGPAGSRKVFKNIGEFAAALPRESPSEISTRFAVKSDFFLVQGVAQYNRAKMASQALVHRDSTRWPQVVYVKMTSS